MERAAITAAAQPRNARHPHSPPSPHPDRGPGPDSIPHRRPHPPQSPPGHRPQVSIKDDIPEDNDPEVNESALSCYELIVKELGATVVEEFTNE